jgi:photosystem II stability/assembly factor-like uncharacterized protein
MGGNGSIRKPMVPILVVLLLLLPLTLCAVVRASGYTGWYAQTSGVTEPIHRISAVSANTAWAAAGLSLLKTIDGGAHWTVASTGLGEYRSVSAVNANIIWASVGTDKVIRTLNGGTDWDQLAVPAITGSFVDMVAIDANSAWLISNYKILRTTTGGASWEDVTDPSVGADLRSITAINANVAWVGVYDGTVMKTTNGGASWSLRVATDYIEGIHAVTANVLYLCGFAVFKSTNGGLTWARQYDSPEGPLMSIAAVDAGTAWVTGFHGLIAKTLDGSRWYQQVSGTTGDLYTAAAADANNAWVGGNNGRIRHTTDGGGYHTPPAIAAMTPNYGRAGTEVTLRGTEFGYPKSQSYVSFGSAEATEYTAWAVDEINVKVPDGISGQVNVIVHTAGGASNAMKFTVFTPTYYSYYFAEGCTREGFEEWLCLQNPGKSALRVNATYMLFGGSAPVQKSYTVPATSRLSVNVNAEVGPGQDVSAKLVAEGEFYAERPMYFDYKAVSAGFGWTGGHCVTGAPAPGTDWYFAEGTTREGFEEWVCLQNPGGAAAVVSVDYISAGAYTVRKQYNVDPSSRLTVFANGDVGPNQDISVHVHSSTPIVAERPMYFNYHGKWDGGHIVMGTDSPKNIWYFAEGSTQNGFDEWLAVQNANNADAHVTCHFMKSDGTQVDKTYGVGANSRWTLDVSSAIGKNQDSSVVVQSDIPVVAERPMYFCYKQGEPGYGWTGGHDVVGSSQVKTGWFFAEGCTLDLFDEYICVGNPGTETATVTMTFMLEKGSPVVKTVTIGAQKRVTVKVADLVGRGHDVSTALTSNKPVVAERPMYFNYGGKWNGGHDVIGF